MQNNHPTRSFSVYFGLLLTCLLALTPAISADKPTMPKQVPDTPQAVEQWWKSGLTLPSEALDNFPLRELPIREDTGINVLVDMAHKCDFFNLWRLGGPIYRRGIRAVGSHATLDSVLTPGSPARVRIPVERGVLPFAWWQTPKFNVVLTEGAVGYPGYIPEEREAVKKFIQQGGGLIVSGSWVRNEESANNWSLNKMLAEYGAKVLPGHVRYEDRRWPRLQISDEWETVIQAEDGSPIYARREFGKGRIALYASSSMYRFNRKDREDVRKKMDFLADTIQWAAKGSKPAGGDTRLPVARGGGGGIYPESEKRLPGIVCFYSKNQLPELVSTVENDFPAITDQIYAWLPSEKPEQPMYMILCSGNGGGWAVNAYLPKEASTISTRPGGIRSIFAHEQAHTMAGPCNAANHPFGGNRGEEHAGWFQGKINAMYNGDKGPNRGCHRVFKDDYTPGTTDPAEIFKDAHLKKWQDGHDRLMIWYVWQKFDDRYGPTWYPRWRWVQGQRWKDEPSKKLTWEESIEDMSIAVGEDLFPFFAKTGKKLDKQRFATAQFMGKTIDLPVAPIEPTPPGDVNLDPIDDYKKPIDVKTAPAEKGKWVTLFNGKNLDGWIPKITGYELGENYANTFRVEDGLLKASYDGYDKFNGRFGHIFYEQPFSNYRLRVEYRFTGDQVPGGPGWAFRNSGIMLHCQPPQTMAKKQNFPVSIEAQMLGGDGTHERTTANVCTPGTNLVMDDKLITRHCISSSSKTYHGDQWVTMEVEVHGNGKIKHIVNGDTVLEYERPQYDPNDADAKKLIDNGNLMIDGGYISLQAESHPVEFRKVEIMLLED
ncbi:hypothetical protein STSP2_03440 [Anaerohalosphaera lusitana]|uniref:3-keto-alpha-glucoside-1,2-lyase/3-keto-2-hydroxy-glucal hydratase domain-containing protein n=1 Tax=Anaerohalosphaera lusitana TaxID=1936003 RepID=A0A1U9NR65_9BACT|nr:DUF1080 domain-containing protein [Anaerohalosphaera lusitana]AQT70234.1 hypothetical protein STSP2_03440 [Anaerohalosphaera lusitana]